MEILQEITDWGEGRIPNHIYHVTDNGKLVAYQISGTDKLIKFNHPMPFDKRRRKFKVLKTVKESTPTQNIGDIEVSGSGGKTYYVNVANQTCTCQGYMFRKKCRHIAEATKNVANM